MMKYMFAPLGHSFAHVQEVRGLKVFDLRLRIYLLKVEGRFAEGCSMISHLLLVTGMVLSVSLSVYSQG